MPLIPITINNERHFLRNMVNRGTLLFASYRRLPIVCEQTSFLLSKQVLVFPSIPLPEAFLDPLFATLPSLLREKWTKSL